MQISNHFSISALDATQSATKAPSTSAAEVSSESLNPVDQLDLSAEAQGISGSESSVSELRIDRIADIRRQIADGSYDTEEKLSAALDKFLDQRV